MYNFNSQTAVQAGIKSGLARRAKAERYREAEAELKRRLLPVALNDRIRQTELQLDRVDFMLADCDDPTELVKLSQVKERLLNSWSLLSGHPRPGVRRPGKTRSSMPELTPTLPDPVPEPLPVVAPASVVVPDPAPGHKPDSAA